MRFVGLDIALGRTGVSIIDVGRAETSVFSITTDRKTSDYDRQISALYQILKAIHPRDVVVLEDFALASRYSQSGKSAERQQLVGMSLLELPKVTGIPWMLCPPSYHKGLVAGKASAHKEDSRKALEEIWGISSSNLDQSDAACLALMGKFAFIPTELDKKRASFVEKFKAYKQNSRAMQQAAFYKDFPI